MNHTDLQPISANPQDALDASPIALNIDDWIIVAGGGVVVSFD